MGDFNVDLKTFFQRSEKKWPTEAVLDRNKINMEVIAPGVFNKTIILLGFAGYKMIVTNSALHIQRALVKKLSNNPEQLVEVIVACLVFSKWYCQRKSIIITK